MGRVIPFGNPLRYDKTHRKAVFRDLPSGWVVENSRHVNRALGLTMDFWTGPEDDDGLPWGTLQLWLHPGESVVVDRLYAATRSFFGEGAPVRVFEVRTEAGDLGFEVKCPQHKAPARFDFHLTHQNFTRFFDGWFMGTLEEAPTRRLSVPPPPGWQKARAGDEVYFHHPATQTKVTLRERYLPPNVFCRVAAFELPALRTMEAALWAVATGFFELGATLHVLGPLDVQPGLRMLTFAQALDGQTPRGQVLVVERAGVEALAAQLAGP